MKKITVSLIIGRVIMMFNSAKIKNSVLLLQIALMPAFYVLTGHIQPPVTAVPLAQSTVGSSTVPVAIDTYGKAWEGYLAFGLWNYTYQTGVFLKPKSYLVVITTKDQVLDLRRSPVDDRYWPVKYLGNDTLMYSAELGGITYFLNLKTNVTTGFPNVYGHHDMIFNPTTKTFLTLRSYVRPINGKRVLFDQVVELNNKGDILQTWDTYEDGHFDLSDACPCNDTTVVNGQTVIDLTHANSLQWNFQTNIVYINIRHLNTFCKINWATNQAVWSVGEHGDFTLLDQNGKQVPSLWYHAHNVQEVEPGVFLMFDNDYHNSTMPCSATYEEARANSRIVEVTVNERNKTAWVSWSWKAPRQYWSPYWGEADRLPNGDRLGTFGSQSHYLPGSAISKPLPNSTGAVIIEVNPKGEVVRTYTFPYAWGIYRVVPISLQTVNDYDGAPHTKDFTISLSTINNIGGPTNIFYRINSGPTKTVSTDGQPSFTTESVNDTLEYWSVDSNGIEESPHKTLTGIILQKSVGAESSTSGAKTLLLSDVDTVFALAIFAAAIAICFAVVRMRVRSGRKPP